MHCGKCNSDLLECICDDLAERINNLRLSPHLAIDWDSIIAANDKFRESLRRVRLTDDYFDLKTGIGFPVDTILVRSPHSGQYQREGTPLGGECVSHFALIKDICKPEP